MGASGPVIIGANAGGSTLARHFAPSLSRVLLLVREDWSRPKPPPAQRADTKNRSRYLGARIKLGGRSNGRRAVVGPSGEQIEIIAGDQQAVVVEVGGGLRAYSVGGGELLDGYGANEMSSSGRGQALIPWPNRLQDGN